MNKDVTQTQSTGAAAPALEPDELRPVEVGDYQLLRELARGGMGVITEAVDRRHGRTVALKRPLGSDEARTRRFLREARLAARLQHPGIVPVYQTGRLPTGEPFIAMKSVEGESLSAVVKKTENFNQRLALLPRLIAVADALAYAHQAGVVHRDLTPKNILVGNHGETLIIDWGVAKELAAPDEEIVSETHSSTQSSSGETQGAVGTPRYMSPEQARGALADPRADVYSLGAVLYFTLAGHAPDGEPLTAPPELVAIVTRAMAEDPAQRYASAAELAADLKRFATGELVRAHDYPLRALILRWARRRRAALVAGGIAVVVVAGVGAFSVLRIARERDAARTAEKHATSLRESGSTLVGFLLKKLYQRLEEVGRLDVLEGLGTEVQRYYASIPASDGDRAAFDQRAGSLTILGDVEEDKGRHEEALSLYHSALDIYDQVAHRFGKNAELLHRIAQVRQRIGDTQLVTGKPAEAERNFAAALASDQAAAVLAPERDDLSRGISLTWMRLGDVRKGAGDFDAARRDFQELETSAREGYRRWPKIPKMLWLVGWAQMRRAELETLVGRWPDAQKASDDATRSLTELVALQPKAARWQQDLSESHKDAGEILLSQGRSEAALARFQKCSDGFQPLAAADPKNGEVARLLAVCEQHAGEALADLGRYAESEKRLRRSIALIEPFARGEGDPAHNTFALSRALLAKTLGPGDEARKLAHAAADELKPHDADGRVVSAWLRSQAALYEGDAGAARQAAVALDEEVRKSPTGYEARVRAVEAWRITGMLELRAGKPGDAFTRALALADRDDDGLRRQRALTFIAAGERDKAGLADLKARGLFSPGLLR